MSMGELIENVIARTGSSTEAPGEPVVPVSREKRPLTHRIQLSKAQMDACRMNVMNPAEDRRAQFSEKIGDNNNRGKARRHPHPQKGTVMNEMNLPHVPQTSTNGTAPQAPSQTTASGIVEKVAGVPYGKAATKGAVFGACAVATGSAVWFGGKFVIGKIRGNPAV